MQITPTNDTHKFNPTRPQLLRLGIMLLFAVLTIAAFVTYFLLGLKWQATPFLGVTVNHNLVVNSSSPNGQTTWAGLDAGLRAGDRIIYISDDLSFEEDDLVQSTQNPSGTHYLDILKNYTTGDQIVVTFIRPFREGESLSSYPDALNCRNDRGASEARCTTEYQLTTIPEADLIAFFAMPFVSGLIILLFALSLLWFRPWENNTFVMVTVLLLLSLFVVGIVDVGSTHRLTPVWLLSGIFFGGSVITVGMIFPSTIPFVYKHPSSRITPLVLSVIVALATLWIRQREVPTALGQSQQIASTFALVSLMIFAALLYFHQRKHAANIDARDRANIIFIGVMIALLPSLFWFGGQILKQYFSDLILPFSIEATSPFYITPAIAITYSLLQKRRLFDTDKAISQGATYTILMATLTLGYFLIVFGGSLFAINSQTIINADNPFVVAVTIFFVSILFVPARTHLQGRIEEAYFRTRYNYQTKLEEFTQKLTSVTSVTSIIKEFRKLLGETIKPINTLIFLANQTGEIYVAYGEPEPETDITFSKDSGVIQLLAKSDSSIYLQPGSPWPVELHTDKARLGIIKVMVIAGMAGSEYINGFIGIGPPRSNSGGYTFEELRFINNLVGQLAIAIERARVIDSLERRVQHLNVLSQVGQAVNFTIEFDDLIELISAQTLRLIPSPYFYIVLYEQPTEQLYFAFFLENDERIEENENQKWPIGNDLYSIIVQSGQSRRIDDYTRIIQKNEFNTHFEATNTKAWMGVPLIAGVRTLGVIAIGETDPNIKHTNDQLRSLTDIAALAASAIEQTRLFTETNIRARQLSALNDISQQLVATEGDVEQLLELITSSAVDILNAEAGSLLLSTDDGSGDLVFKTAIGGTGHELIGQRLKAGFGLVGKVAETGQPIISNDTKKDEKWDGEVSEGKFTTNSILAVPLIAKQKVVGVLEVLNKKDGSVYIQEDVELLTTFAGQAAVAYENARLFQQTDLQLTQRVQELESLERIDREMNRTLNLQEVAAITIRWAISNSNATSGFLGVVTEDQNQLRIISKQGYEDDDVPEGANNDIWPLDRGIVKRVMRTRRADLQPYVQMDPDYIPSLKASLSQITIPMLSGDVIMAILVLETNKEPRLNLLDQDWVQRLAEHASIAIANAQLYAELLRANESKSEFVGFAAHELKNPLTSVKGYAETLLNPMMRKMMNEEQQNDMINVIRTNAERMQVIITDMRDIARIDAKQLTMTVAPIAFRDVVIETLQTYQRYFDEKGQKLINNIGEDIPYIMGDRIRLVQVLTNLISNANKYSPLGATITINAYVENHHLTSQRKQIGPALRISIQDTGLGMSNDDLKKIFRVRYFRSTNSAAQEQPGTGLGMMITQNIIEQHGGKIWVESELGKGSNFQFVIPLAPQEENQSSESEGVEKETEPASD